MAVVIRLQGLPVSAGSVDIRHFFTGLTIPDGGVHIIGGKLGEAFIIFATDEDARRAMSRNGGLIKDNHVQLLLSSKSEMQSTLEASRKNSRKHPAVAAGSENSKPETGPKKPNSQNKFDKTNSEPAASNRGKRNAYAANVDQEKADDLYLFLYGLPYSATEEDVRTFFKGLDVIDIVFCVRQKGRNGNALVKFRSAQDATAALAHDNEYMGSRYISLKKTTEQQWIQEGGQVGGAPSRPPKRPRSRSPPKQEFYVHLKNLSYNVEKPNIKHFLGLPDLPDAQIKFLLDGRQNRTREGFVLVRNEWQYEKCLSMNNVNFNGHPVFVVPISRKAMLDLIESSESQPQINQRGSPSNYQNRGYQNLKRYIYLRNFPFDVTKVEVQRFFTGFPVHVDDICLLFDSKGVGLGEALVKFPSEEQALLAERLDRQPFLGTEVLLRRISDEQLKEFGPLDEPVRHDLPPPMHRDEFRPREPMGMPYPRPGDVPYGRARDFRGSPERFRGPNPMGFSGPDRRFDMRGNGGMDYRPPLPGRRKEFEDRPDFVVVRMKNLPFTANVEEILDFFYGYNVIQNSVDLKYTSNGTSTGIATVCFRTLDEAVAAVDELNERPIGERKIGLSILRK
ncbi:RNA-binding protein 12B-like [Gastrophryne carolinensis]